MVRRVSHAGFSLVEVVMTITVLAVVAGVTFPVMNAAGDVYSAASDARDASDSCAFAIDRVVRLVRECPSGESAGEVGIATASAGEIAFTDGRSVRLDGDTLVYEDGEGLSSPLCRGVEAFELTYLGDDGETDTSSSAEQTRRVGVMLRASGFELRSAAFIRIGMVQ